MRTINNETVDFPNLRKSYIIEDNIRVLHLYYEGDKEAWCGEALTYIINEPPSGNPTKNCIHCFRRITNRIPFGE